MEHGKKSAPGHIITTIHTIIMVYTDDIKALEKRLEALRRFL